METDDPIERATSELARNDLLGALHPSTDALVRYANDEAEGLESDAIAEHLALCAECADTALCLMDDAELPDVDVESAWRTFQERIASEETPSDSGEEPIAFPTVPTSPPPRRRLWQLVPTAAAIALGAWGLSLDTTVRELSSSASPTVKTVDADAVLMDDGTLTLEADPEGTILRFVDVDGLWKYGLLAFELRRGHEPDGTPIDRRPTKAVGGVVTYQLPKWLTPGTYTLRLLGGQDDEELARKRLIYGGP